MASSDLGLIWDERGGVFSAATAGIPGLEVIGVARADHGWCYETSGGERSSVFTTVDEAKAAAAALFTRARNSQNRQVIEQSRKRIRG